MRFQKKIFSFIMVSSIIIFILSGCAKSTDQTVHTNIQSKIIIYTTLFPLYDFARQIGGNQVEVHNLIPPGTEPHDFEPNLREMMALQDADLFVYNGAGYETWVKKAVENINLDNTIVVDASANLGLLEEGQEHDNEIATDHKDHEHLHGDHDPHVWLDPIHAKEQANKILQALVEIAPEKKAVFQDNFDKFASDLNALDKEYTDISSRATKREVVVSHQAFGYLAARYGFEQIAVTGLSPSDEPSQKELQNLIQLLKEHKLKYVAFDSFFESKVAETVLRETGAVSVTLHTIENVTKEQQERGVTYINLMRDNLETLKKVLEVK